MRKIKISIMYEFLVMFGLVCIGGGVFLHKRESKKGGYVRLHTDEDVKEYRDKLSKDSTEEEKDSGGYTNLFSNVLGKSEESEYEKKVRKLREKKKKRGWQSMGLFGS